MATYCMSDLHGMYGMFNNMLEKIQFTDSDVLYIIGDVIDYGPESIKLLKKVMGMKNAHLLLGDHEWRVLTFHSSNISQVTRFNAFENWKHSGGIETIDDFINLQPNEKSEIINYLRRCKLADQVNVAGRGFCMIHAWPKKDPVQALNYVPKLNEDPRMIKGQTLIIGHVPTCRWHMGPSKEDFLKYAYGAEERKQHMRIEHAPHFIGINCAAYWSTTTDAGALACLRLDDMQEFYVTKEDN